MDFYTWQETVERNCPRIRNVRGGANCRDPANRITGFCTFERCPRLDGNRELITER